MYWLGLKRSIQLWVHSEKGAKRVSSIAKKHCVIVMGLKTAANHFDELRANGPHSL
jgi:hypothetical protein